MGISEKLKELLVYLGILFVLYLFYKSVFVFPLLLPCIAVYRKIHRKALQLKRKAVLRTQFKDMLESMASSLRAGYSVNNALMECAKDMKAMHGEDSPIYTELTIMLNQLGMGVGAAEALNQFAERTGLDDAFIFASVYTTASKSGGNLIEIIKKSADDIGNKIDTENEIDVLISGKKLEMNIMSLIPIGIIAYIDITTEGLLDPLYGNLAGVIIMTVCLIIYAAAVVIGRKMVSIEV